MDQIEGKTISELLALHVSAVEELRRKGVLRSANNPTGDLAEYLFCNAFGWEQAPNSERGYDATDKEGIRYQIKGRRIHRRNKSRQLSAIRDLTAFDYLAGVLFDDDYRVLKACLVPVAVVRAHAKYIAHTNSHKFMLRDDVWNSADVIDVTDKLRATNVD